jgi:flagellar basal-body rod protein FlgF
MDSLTTAAASGMRSRMEALDLLANNIANASAPGFKADREFYAQYISAEAVSDASTATMLPVIERNWTDFSQGSLVPTGNPLDIALSGKGFLTAMSPSGTVFTRDGGLHLSTQGELETQDGYPVQDSNGKAIRVDPSKPVEITPDGTVLQDGQELARISVVDFPDASALSKRGHAYFSSSAQSLPSNALVEQGKIESANSQPAESAVRLIGVMRQFEMLQRAMTIGTEMNKRALEEVARIAS